MYYVYIIKCKDEKLYVGCTNNLKDRMNRHINGQIPATKGRGPLKLISCVLFIDKYKAFQFEKYLKSASGRAFLNKRLI